MSTTRTYRCNLCHYVISDDAQGRGIYYTGDWPKKNAMEIRNLRDAENHVCNACFEQLVAAHKRSQP